MILRGIDFGSIMNASGARGFFGEKYLHQRLLGPFGPDFNGCTFVAKTTTLEARKGNMPMKADGITPKELRPKCIKVYFIKGVMLNAIGLSGPGAKALFETGRWQKRTEPFFISFMSVAPTAEQRIEELRGFVSLFAYHLPCFKAKVGLQINYSCPNVGLNLDYLVDEASIGLHFASFLGIPLMPKFNVLAPVKIVKKISDDLNCDGICVTNTIHWNDLPKVGIDRKELFGSDVSPLVEFGGGALSGKHLFPLVAKWVRDAKYAGVEKEINTGGGIISTDDLVILHDETGTSSVSIGSVATLRPWRVKKIVEKAHGLF